MTPKEKADELVYKCSQLKLMEGGWHVGEYTAKRCALIAIDEILILCPYPFWQKVKEEINNL